jgi:hypothetical protein
MKFLNDAVMVPEWSETGKSSPKFSMQGIDALFISMPVTKNYWPL